MKLCDFIIEDAVIAELEARDRNGAIQEIAGALGRGLGLDEPTIAEMVKQAINRENQGSTGFGKGVAVPHVRLPGLKQIAGALGRSSQGIDFAALDRAPVYVVFFLLSPSENPDQHLAAMENIFRHLQRDNFRRFLRQASTQEEINALLREADEIAGN